MFQMKNNNQGGKPNVNISGIFKYAAADYGASWATTATITASLKKLFPTPVNGDAAILRNTNGSGETRTYKYANGAWAADSTTTISDGAVATAKLADGVLSVDATGLGKMADGYLAASTAGRAKMADGFVTTAKIGDAQVTPVKVSTNVVLETLSYQVEDLAADGDISTQRNIFVVPTGAKITLVSADIISGGTAAGIDASNTCVVAVKDGSNNTIVTKTYNNTTVFPAAGAVDNLGTLNATYKVIDQGGKIGFTVVNGTTANPPGFMLQITYTVSDH